MLASQAKDLLRLAGFDIIRARPRGTDALVYPAIGERPVIFDIGAHHGETSLQLRRNWPGAEIHAFEPHGGNYERLTATIDGDAVCHRIAFGERRETLALRQPAGRNDFHCSLARDGAVVGEVEVWPLDAFCEARGIEHIDLLKLDVEAHEVAVLRGASGLLARRAVRYVLAEAGIERPAGEPAITPLSELVAVMAGHGYGLDGLYDVRYVKRDPRRLKSLNALFAAPADAPRGPH